MLIYEKIPGNSRKQEAALWARSKDIEDIDELRSRKGNSD
jgi:hypothetical protein